MTATISVLISFSWLFLLGALSFGIVLFAKFKETSLSTKILLISAVLFLSILLMRLATSLYIDFAIGEALLTDKLETALGEYAVEIPFGAHFVRSVTQTLRTFAIDEDVKIIFIAAESMQQQEIITSGFMLFIYKLHAAVVTVLAPVASGAIIFDILTRFFPKLRFRVKYAGREFYIFSELNESSLALAESIIKNCEDRITEKRKAKKKAESTAEANNRILDEDLILPIQNKKKEPEKKQKQGIIWRPVIVFTDVYADQDEEVASERIAAAKKLGAICFTDDILHIKICGFIRRKFRTKCNYLLIDEKEDNNLHTLSLLSEQEKGENLQSAFVYLFSSSTSTTHLISCINKKFKSNENIPEDRRPVIRVIDGYKNLVYNLLTEVPLYEPLIGRKQEGVKKLNVTIVGSGLIGMQMFLATYWMGQMLDVKLHINVVSQEKEKSFKDRINLINADILKSEASVSDDELLRIYARTKEKAEPYFTMRYFETDVMTGELYDVLSRPVDSTGFTLCKSDYFVVAIGSDEKNILVANKLKCYIGRELLGNSVKRRAVINYVVYDKAVCDSLNLSRRDPVVYMNAFGNFSQVYNYGNVFMSKTYGTAMELNKAYNQKSNNMKLYDKKDMEGFLKDEYKYWSSIARGLHIPYKYFSAGVLTKSWCFDNACCAVDDVEVFNAYLRKVCVELESTASALPTVKEREDLYYRLCWLEHRRWNAFLRTGGFTMPSEAQLEAYVYMNGNYTKELNLKLHPCLVECDDKAPLILSTAPRSADISPAESLDMKSIYEKNYDRLDAVSMYLHIRAKERVNDCCCIYKAYDSPYEIYDGVLKIQ